MATYHVYILPNWNRTTLYTGATSNLAFRTDRHRQAVGGAFTTKYKVNKLIYYEEFDNILEAIAREKQIKSGSRKRKEDLINGFNPGWLDLFDDIKE